MMITINGMIRLITAASFVSGLALLGACDSTTNTPAEVAKAVHMAANDLDAGTFKKLVVTEDVNKFTAREGIIEKVMKKVSRNQSIEKVEVFDETIKGDRATVRTQITFKGRPEANSRTWRMTKEAGQWKFGGDRTVAIAKWAK